MKEQRMKELVAIINEASDAYYNEDREIMSNFEYDALYDELVALEQETGVVLPNSPTSFAGYEAVSRLEKSEHEYPALSLAKTKDKESLIDWLKGKKGVLSWKMDGLTVVLTYNKGKLIKAVTRGNGITGEIVTHNVKHFSGVPQKVSFNEKLIVRGEAIMTQTEFERINSLLPETAVKYKNPRNLASATTRLFDASEASERKMEFSAFDLVYFEGEKNNSKEKQLKWLEDNGFSVVEHVVVDGSNVVKKIEDFKQKLPSNDFPSDGLVLIFDDEEYGLSLGNTGKYPRNGIAFKWQDKTEKTKLLDIEWSASRTGLINPVAIFESVELEGTTVSRASIHNVSIAKELKLGIGSTIEVFKANLIIPQIAKTVVSTGETIIPDKCPVCGAKTRIFINDDVETLYCTSNTCPAKLLYSLVHFVSRDCMNIVGFSKATIERFIDCGFIKTPSDIYKLNRYEDEIINMQGFGEKSYKNLMTAIENSKTVKFSAFLNSLGIPCIGKDLAKLISKNLGKDALNKFINKLRMSEGFDSIEGIGEIINLNIYAWKSDKNNGDEFAELVNILNIEDDTVETKASGITGKTFVITGSVYSFKNRDELKEFIEQHGGKTSGSVSAKTDYLINNDIESNSGKNKKAKELGIKIITEEDFKALL